MIQWSRPIREEKMLEGYRVLSLFDGMGCAHLAMQGAGLQVERYVAFEVDRFCNEAVAHNFPDAEQRGDVFDADFTEFEGFDFLMGGSPCTYWSVAQSADRREVTASGMGWELFQQYVRALREARPRWFIYENNKSMSRAIRDSISAEFGFEPVWINSALVSAQKRDRLYWVGRREPDGTYSRVPVEQPADRGILLRDVLETGIAWKDKSYACTTRVAGATVKDTLERHRHTMVAEPVGITEDGKSFVLPATHYKGSSPEQTLTKRRRTLVAEPVATAPVRVGGLPTKDGGKVSTSQSARIYSIEGKSVTLQSGQNTGGGRGALTGLYAVPTEPLAYDPPEDYGVVVTDRNIRATTAGPSGVGGTAQGYTVMLPDSKTNAMTAGQCHKSKVIEPLCDEGLSPVYEVKDGEIEIRGRKYPIGLSDGKYIIRKLTVRECMRLQTVPEWYDFSCVSNTQAYKMLGNGWTVEVIVHLLRSIMEGEGDADSGSGD